MRGQNKKKEMRELSMDEIDQVSGGYMSSSDATVVSGLFATGAALTGSFALVPGPHVPFAGALAVVMGASAAGFSLMGS